MKKVVRIGAGSATLSDSRTAMPQLLHQGGPLDYLVFDCLAEAVMAMLGRTDTGYVTDFIDGRIMPYLGELLDRGIKVIANAGGLDPAGCAQALRDRATAAGLSPRIGVVEGDNLLSQLDTFIGPDTRDMFDGTPLRPRVDEADRILSLTAYTGAFPIAAALAAGADIVITGRAVDSAATLGALIHEFGWGIDDFDLLAAGSAAGHLIECTTQVTGGTFTDWQDVPDWAGIGFPIAECFPNGDVIITKPEGTGGLVSTATASEQLLYEVSDPQHYIVPDVICDFTGVKLASEGRDRVRISNVRGLGRPETLKLTLTYDSGWRATAVMPVIGRDAAAKARRVSEALFERTTHMLRDAQMPPWLATHYDVIGGEGEGPTTAICRIVAHHSLAAGAQLLAREHSSVITSMAVGTAIPITVGVTPLQQIGSFTCPRDRIALTVTVDGAPVPHAHAATGHLVQTPLPAPPAAPDAFEPGHEVPLIRLAWARSGDKGNLFNVGVIARDPAYLPYIYQALSPEAVGRFFADRIGDGMPYPVQRYAIPGFDALNLVVGSSLQGGLMASPMLDPAAKGMAQLLLDFPIAVPAAFMESEEAKTYAL